MGRNTSRNLAKRRSNQKHKKKLMKLARQRKKKGA
jgi:hypothetical protein